MLYCEPTYFRLVLVNICLGACVFLLLHYSTYCVAAIHCSSADLSAKVHKTVTGVESARQEVDRPVLAVKLWI